MKTKSVFIVLISLIPITGICMTENSKVSILTSEPGSELYTLFGHTAIRINDSSIGIDKVYNFGTFDFSSPFFYARFLKGNLDYFLSVNDYAGFIHNSQLEGRRVYEQILNLNFSEKSNLFYNLERQYNSDYRFYKYDFFYDNCATRVRDAIFNAYNKPIEYDTNSYCCQTFRQLLKPYISKNYWIDFVVNLSLGKNADKVARPNDFMFLPFYIKNILQDAHIVEKERLVIDAPISGKTVSNFSYLSPWLIASLIILASFLTKYRKLISYFFFSLVGLTGLILLIISLVSDNPAFSGNLNIYWTMPSIIILLFRNRTIKNIVALSYLINLISLLLFWNILSQEFSITIIPWITTLMILLLMDLQWFKHISRIRTATVLNDELAPFLVKRIKK
ncbi:MAG: DUF4105 domain-containing protein [Dehalococcoidales bacterium]|jgi:hypothetical protein|nr:DUF4105 domain-containing protein [Dehalococcoidales bacterium]